MGSSSTSLPPLPGNSSSGSAPPMAPQGNGTSPSPSAFSGGLPGMQAAVQQIEAGSQQLAQLLPSLAPMIAESISKLRMAIPAAMSAGANGAGGQDPSAPSGPEPSAQPGIPPPPAQ